MVNKAIGIGFFALALGALIILLGVTVGWSAVIDLFRMTGLALIFCLLIFAGLYFFFREEK